MNAYAGLVIGTTPDSAFEEEFLAIPEVRLFTIEYLNYTASHDYQDTYLLDQRIDRWY